MVPEQGRGSHRAAPLRRGEAPALPWGSPPAPRPPGSPSAPAGGWCAGCGEGRRAPRPAAALRAPQHGARRRHHGNACPLPARAGRGRSGRPAPRRRRGMRLARPLALPAFHWLPWAGGRRGAGGRHLLCSRDASRAIKGGGRMRVAVAVCVRTGRVVRRPPPVRARSCCLRRRESESSRGSCCGRGLLHGR